MKKATILIVDDDEINISMLKNKLGNEYKIKIAYNGLDAFKILEKNDLDLILLDIEMPIMDGYEIAKKILSDEKTKDIPIIFLTVKNDNESIIKGFNLGAKDFISKPFEQKELEVRIKTHLTNYLQKKEIELRNKEIELRNKEILGKEKIITDYLISSETDLNGIITSVSKSFCKLSGYNENELVNKPHNILRHPTMSNKVFKELWETIKRKQIWSGEIKNKTKNGDSYWIYETISPKYDENNKHIGYISWIQEITAKKIFEKKVSNQAIELQKQNEILYIHQAELEAQNDELFKTQEKLKESTIRYENLFNGTPYPIVLVNHNLEIKILNTKFSNEFISKNLYLKNISLLQFVSKDYYLKAMDYFNNNNESNLQNNIIKMKTSNHGERRYKFKKNIHPIDKDLFIISLIDIEDELLLEEKIKEQNIQVSHQAKMAALGNMIENIAHQWRQPLNAISVSASAIKLQNEMDLLTKESIDNFIPVIISNTEYLSETIDTFRNYMNENKTLTKIFIQDRIKKALDIVKFSFNENYIKIIDNTDYDNPISAKLVYGELSQVLINILNNAKDALKEKNIKNPYVEINLVKKNDFITITIEDNAGGIPTNIIDKIFEPYFTTKHKSKGTGLGLYMSFKIITESLKGNLYVKNTNNGAKFSIEIPLL